MSRLVQIGFVWCGCALAWVILGSTLMARSGEFSTALTEEVQHLWGPPLEQRPPTATWVQIQKRKEVTTVVDANGVPRQSTVEKEEAIDVPIDLVSSKLVAKVELEHRKKGLLWFPTYGIDFKGDYTFENRSGLTRELALRFPIDAQNAGLDGFSVRSDDGQPVAWRVENGAAQWTARIAEGARVRYAVAFHTRGTTSWKYLVTHGTGEARDFHLALETNFPNVDFPTGSISPSQHRASGETWKGEWHFESLIASTPVGITLPQRLNPGPLAARITYFAPVGLLFFFFVAALLGQVQRHALHPLHYFFIGCAFFAFHLLFGYLADHVSVGWVFGISSAVSLFLVVTYVRLFAGWRFALVEIGLAQLIYLVLFSLSFLLEGFTGLAITCGAIATLFVMMQVMGRRPVSPSGAGGAGDRGSARIA